LRHPEVDWAPQVRSSPDTRPARRISLAGNFINSHHVSGQTAFLWSPTGWIFALDVNTGALRWRHRTTAYDGHKDAWASVLAELASDELYLYALDMGHVLHVLDRHTGEERARVAIGPALRPAQLVQQPRQIVVASEAGEVLWMGVCRIKGDCG
jgi:outer membrane protein assembly factor BamB